MLVMVMVMVVRPPSYRLSRYTKPPRCVAWGERQAHAHEMGVGGEEGPRTEPAVPEHQLPRLSQQPKKNRHLRR